MRRLAITVVLIVAAIAAIAAVWYAQRPMIVERPTIGGPPRPPAQHQNLVGRKVPSFAAADMNRQPAGTSGARGRVIVVDVWATWCAPCREEMPRIENEIWRRFSNDVSIVAIADREGADKLHAFNAAARLTFPLIPDPHGTIAPHFGGHDAIPRIYVADRNGVIAYQQLGYGDESFRRVVAAVERAVAAR